MEIFPTEEISGVSEDHFDTEERSRRAKNNIFLGKLWKSKPKSKSIPFPYFQTVKFSLKSTPFSHSVSRQEDAKVQSPFFSSTSHRYNDLIWVEASATWDSDDSYVKMLISHDRIGSILFSQGEALHLSKLAQDFSRLKHKRILVGLDIGLHLGLNLENTLDSLDIKIAYHAKEVSWLIDWGKAIAKQCQMLGIHYLLIKALPEKYQPLQQAFIEGINQEGVGVFIQSPGSYVYTLYAIDPNISGFRLADVRDVHRPINFSDLLQQVEVALVRSDQALSALEAIKQQVQDKRLHEWLEHKLDKLDLLKFLTSSNQKARKLSYENLNPSGLIALKQKFYHHGAKLYTAHRERFPLKRNELQQAKWISLGSPMHPEVVLKFYNQIPSITMQSYSVAELSYVDIDLDKEPAVFHFIAILTHERALIAQLLERLSVDRLSQVILIFFTHPFPHPILKQAFANLVLYDGSLQAQKSALQHLLGNSQEIQNIHV